MYFSQPLRMLPKESNYKIFNSKIRLKGSNPSTPLSGRCVWMGISTHWFRCDVYIDGLPSKAANLLDCIIADLTFLITR
jgi:hypothetical protein